MPSIEERRIKVNAEIQELRKKIQLSEGESKAFYEEAEGEKKNSRERVNQLRSQIKQLHVKLHEAKQGSEKAVEEALQSKKKKGPNSAPTSARVVKSDQAVELSEYRLHDYVKRLNFLQHNASQKELRLVSLRKQLEEAGPQRAKGELKTINDLKKEHIKLQNEMDRILIQVMQSEGVKKRYDAMITSLKGEAATHGTFIDALQVNLLQEKDALKNLKESRRKAEKTRDDLRSHLHHEEDSVFEARREREKRLEDCRKQVDEKGMSEITELASRKMSLLRTPTQRLSPIPGQDIVEPPERINQEMERFLQLFSKLKDVLGVTSVDQVIERLTSQKATHIHLQKLRDATLQDLNSLKQEKELLQQQLHRVKYAATEDSVKLDGAFGELESSKSELQEKKARLEETLEEELKVIAGARATLELMVETLMKEEESDLPDKKSEMSFEYILNLMKFCLTNSMKCLEEIRELEEAEESEKEEALDEFGISDRPIAQTTSHDNVRVPFHTLKVDKPTGPQPEDGADSGEEEEALARRFIKRQAQTIVETKSRKRNRPVSTFRS